MALWPDSAARTFPARRMPLGSHPADGGVGEVTVPGPVSSGPRGTVLSLGFVATAASALAATLASSVATVVVGFIFSGSCTPSSSCAMSRAATPVWLSDWGAGSSVWRCSWPALSSAGSSSASSVDPAQVAEVVLGYAILCWAIARVVAARRRKVAWA